MIVNPHRKAIGQNLVNHHGKKFLLSPSVSIDSLKNTSDVEITSFSEGDTVRIYWSKNKIVEFVDIQYDIGSGWVDIVTDYNYSGYYAWDTTGIGTGSLELRIKASDFKIDVSNVLSGITVSSGV